MLQLGKRNEGLDNFHCPNCDSKIDLEIEIYKLRFISKISNHNLSAQQCWIWNSTIDKNGYGAFRFASTTKAHIASYLLFNGPIKKGLVVMHQCHNKLCVNPSHLKVGTWQDNADQRVERKSGVNHLKKHLAETNKK